MITQLTIQDRLNIQAVTLIVKPEQGKLVDFQVFMSIIDAVKFSAEEINRFELKDAEQGTQYNPQKAETKEVEFFPEQLEIIKKGVMIIDEQSAITYEIAVLAHKLGII